MITIQSAESALRNIYLDSVINDINTRTNPFLTMVAKNTRTVNGKEARATIRYGNEKAVAGGVEGGALPTNTNAKSAEIISPLKNLYGTFQISDKAIRAAQNSPGAFASLLSSEMQNLVSTAQANLNAMLYGNGLKLLGYAEDHDAIAKTFKVPARFLENFTNGTTFTVQSPNSDSLSAGVLTVSGITANTITYTGSFAAHRFDRFYVYSDQDTDVSLNGIDSIFNLGKIYNLALTEHPAILPCKVGDPDKTTPIPMLVLNEDEIMKFFDAYEEHCQGMPADILLTHPIVRKAVFEDLRDLRANVDTTELAGGFRGFSFNGIPVYSDLKCKAGTLYALNSDSWKMHQLCDWTWLAGDDGSVLKQIDGRAGYSATLVKYADLICEKPFLQGRAANYSAKKAK